LRVAIAADHAGFELKAQLAPRLIEMGHVVSDLGTNSTAPVDYPDFAEAAALAVIRGDVDRAVVICGSGVGASVAANKVPGIANLYAHFSVHYLAANRGTFAGSRKFPGWKMNLLSG
jgi:ribose 5-phosphate isomerase B